MKNPLSAPPRSRSGSNAEFPWHKFDSHSYFNHNYRELRQDDQKIVQLVRDFFSKVHGDRGTRGNLKGLDVGTGANLYPTFTMLPLCDSVTMWEYAETNTDWLRRQIKHYDDSWDAFWSLLAGDPLYGALEDPRHKLSQVADVRRGSIFDLPAANWDIGTMFFVAESLTTELDEFQTATRRFLRALRPGAPFAAAFMENSTGYQVGDRWFPAVAVTCDEIMKCLKVERIEDPIVGRIELDDRPLRDGYSGMILATGISASRE